MITTVTVNEHVYNVIFYVRVTENNGIISSIYLCCLNGEYYLYSQLIFGENVNDSIIPLTKEEAEHIATRKLD